MAAERKTSGPPGPGKGRRPRKVPEFIRAKVSALERIAGTRLPPTDEDIARALRGETGWRAYPHPDGKSWTAATARSTRHAIRLERFELLRRLSSVLSPLSKRPSGASRSEFAELARGAGISPYWLWDRLRDSSFFPKGIKAGALLVVDESQNEIRIRPTEWGAGLSSRWSAVEAFDPAELDVARTVLFADWAVLDQLDVVCRRFHVSSFELIASDLFESAPWGVQLSETGKAAAEAWDFHTAGWDANYWPAGGEEEAMPRNWDWDRRPFMPSDLVQPAIERLWSRTTPKVRSVLRAVATAPKRQLESSEIANVLGVTTSSAAQSVLDRLRDDLVRTYEETPNIPELIEPHRAGDEVVLHGYRYLRLFLPSAKR